MDEDQIMYLVERLYILKNKTTYDDINHIIAQYLIDHLRCVDQIVLKTMAKEISTSQSTITRFCQDAGFDGFLSFRNELSVEARDRKLYFGHLEDSHQKLIDDDLFFQSKINYLQECRQFIDQEMINKLCHLITSSQRVVIYGDIFYATLFLTLSNYLEPFQIQLSLPLIWSLKKQDEFLSTLTSEDLLIIISMNHSYFSYHEMCLFKMEIPAHLFDNQGKRVFIGGIGGNAYDQTLCIPIAKTKYSIFYEDAVMDVVNRIKVCFVNEKKED